MTQDEIIQKYLSHTLTKKERDAFESELLSNKELKEALEFHKDLAHTLRHHEATKLKTELQEIDKKNASKHHATKSQKLVYLAIAAALIMGLFYNIFNVNSGGNLFYDYFEIYPNTYKPVTRGAESSIDSEAFRAYEAGDFLVAENEFSILIENNNDPNLKFYYAMSLLNQGKTEIAIRELKPLSELDFGYKNETLWFLALAETKNENFHAARKWLQLLESSDSLFKSEERQLLLETLEDK